MAVVVIKIGGDVTHHRRFVLRTDGDGVVGHHQRFQPRTGGDEAHHQRFVTRTGGDKHVPISFFLPQPFSIFMRYLNYVYAVMGPLSSIEATFPLYLYAILTM